RGTARSTQDPSVEREIVVHHAVHIEPPLDGRAHSCTVEFLHPAHGCDSRGHVSDEKSSLSVAHDLEHRSAAGCDHGGAAGHRLDDAEAEGLVEVDEVQERSCSAEQLSAPVGADRTEVAHTLTVDPRLDELLEIVA